MEKLSIFVTLRLLWTFAKKRGIFQRKVEHDFMDEALGYLLGIIIAIWVIVKIIIPLVLATIAVVLAVLCLVGLLIGIFVTLKHVKE